MCEVFDNIESKIIDLPVIESVTRGLWRSVSHSSRTVYVENDQNNGVISESGVHSDKSNAHELDDSDMDMRQQDLVEESELEESIVDSYLDDSEEDEKDEELQQDIREMKKLISVQNISKASKY